MRLTARSPTPVRVCFVIDRLNRAGTETQLVALLNSLDRRHVQPSLCLLNSDESASLETLPGCPVLDLRLRKLASAAAVPAASRLASFWRRHRVEVVQTYFVDSTYFAAPLARLCGISRVVRVRNNVGYWLTPRHRWLGRVCGRLGITLTNSEDARRAVARAEGLADERIAVIENGVDADRFTPLPQPNTNRLGVRIGAIANLRPVKNIDGLIRVAATLCRERPDLQFEVAGTGDLNAALQQQIDATGLRERFVLRGPVADIPNFLARLDIAVLASHSESMSNALLEYMAAGRAIVATDVGANARLVRHEQEGLVVPARDDSAIVEAIRRYLAHPDLAHCCALAARMRAASDFSRQTMVRRFEEFLRSIARTSSPRTTRGLEVSHMDS